MHRSQKGRKATFPLRYLQEQEIAGRTSAKEEVQQVSWTAYSAQGNQGISLGAFGAFS